MTLRVVLRTLLCLAVAYSSTLAMVANAQVAPTTSATVSGSVRDPQGKPVADATVTLSGPRNAVTRTDYSGDFVFVGVPFGAYTITTVAPGLGKAVRSNVYVQNDINIAIAYTPTVVNGIKVIASVSSNANATFNVTAASVTQVDPIAKALDGSTSWRTVLEQIPGVAQAGVGSSATNGFQTYASLPDGPLMPVKVAVNGALPYETATLVDNMPLIGGSISSGLAGTGTDLGLYPLNAFGAADVVRGPGASAPSIVDSIGGSFILHPSGAVFQNHAIISLTTDPYGGIIGNSIVAMRAAKLSAVFTYGVNDSPGPLHSAGIPAETLFLPSFVDGKAFMCPNCQQNLSSPKYAAGSDPTFGFKNSLLVCCFQETTAWSQHGGSTALHYAMSPTVSFDFFYAGQASTQSQPAPTYTVDFAPPVGYGGNLAAGRYLFSNVGIFLAPTPVQQSSSLLEEKATAQIGVGMLQLAALQNRTFSAQTIASATTVSQQLFGGGCIASSTASPSGSCPTGFAPIVFNGQTHHVNYNYLFDGEYQNSNNRDLLFSYSSPIGSSMRGGVSFVPSYYDIPNQNDFFLGKPYGFGGSSGVPPDVSQTTDELRVFLGGTPSQRTSLDLSGYFVSSSYHVQNPDAKDLANPYVNAKYTYAAPRLGFVWRPTPAVAVRAAAGGGYADAPLGDLVGTNGVPSCSGGVCNTTLTNLELRPETSFAFDVGADIRVQRNTIVSLDLYRSNLFGQLYSSTTKGQCPANEPICKGQILYTTQFENLGRSRFEGLLLDVRHDVPHGMYWGFSGGLTRGYVISVPAGFYNNASGACNQHTGTTPDGNPCPNITVVPGVNFNGQFTTVSVPYSQAFGTLGYRWSPEKYAELVGTYFGNNNTYFRPAFAAFDGNVGYPITKNVSLTLTFRNITGIYGGAVQVWSEGNLIGVPAVAGAPYPEYGEEYGPRAIMVTTTVHI